MTVLLCVGGENRAVDWNFAEKTPHGSDSKQPCPVLTSFIELFCNKHLRTSQNDEMGQFKWTTETRRPGEYIIFILFQESSISIAL